MEAYLTVPRNPAAARAGRTCGDGDDHDHDHDHDGGDGDDHDDDDDDDNHDQNIFHLSICIGVLSSEAEVKHVNSPHCLKDVIVSICINPIILLLIITIIIIIVTKMLIIVTKTKADLRSATHGKVARLHIPV